MNFFQKNLNLIIGKIKNGNNKIRLNDKIKWT